MPPEEWAVERSSGVCGVCAKAFAPKDVRFSALYREKASLVRRDYCASCWNALERGAEISFWRSLVPEPEEEEEDRKKRRADAALSTDTLFDILRETCDSPDPERRRFRFVVALILMRRKKLKLVQIARRTGESGQEEDVLVLAMTGRGSRATFEIADVKMSEQEMLAAQDEVERLLAETPSAGAGDQVPAGTQMRPEDVDARGREDAATGESAAGAETEGGSVRRVSDDRTAGGAGPSAGAGGVESERPGGPG